MSESTQKDRITQLEEEGEIAADYLEELLDIADLDGDIEIDVENGRASVEVVSESAGSLDRLVGEDGKVLDALQELTRLAVQTETGERSRLMLDVAGFRSGRKAELQALTEEAITRLRMTGEPQRLVPMNPFERKVCHDVVSAAGLVSESEGAEPNRRVVILAAGSQESDDQEVEVSEETSTVETDVAGAEAQGDGTQVADTEGTQDVDVQE
ncbi:MAG: single-stranded DNA-binding protein [Actinomyces sp.]|nr:single-stranded DNA-binding protein [Actinomyces sp.]